MYDLSYVARSLEYMQELDDIKEIKLILASLEGEVERIRQRLEHIIG